MFIKLMKLFLWLFVIEIGLLVAFDLAVAATARVKLGHKPDQREFKCQGRKFLEAFGRQQQRDDLECNQ
jgi:hypothetical protein